MQLATAFLTANHMIEAHLEYVPIEVSDQCQELRVPDRHIGAVLGRGGKRINDVRMMSGCKIKIEREDGSGIRRITLTGDVQKIIMATYLINQMISSFSTAGKDDSSGKNGDLNNGSKSDPMNSLASGMANNRRETL